MTGAGNLVVHLMAQTQHFEQGMRRGVSHSNRMRDSVGKLSGGMRSLAGAFGMSLGVGGLVLGLRRSIGLAQEQIKQERKLEAVLRATGYAAGFSAKELKAHASALQQTTNFGDEATIGAQSVLATFKEIRGDTFKGATVVIQDMAAVLGTDLQSAAIQVGKALNDPTKGITALSRAGVSFTAQQKEQIKTMQEAGDMLGAQKIVLGELKGEFGGAATAIADPITQMKNNLGDFGETIGTAVLPVVKSLASGISTLTSATQGFIEIQENMREIGAFLGGGTEGLANYIKTRDRLLNQENRGGQSKSGSKSTDELALLEKRTEALEKMNDEVEKLRLGADAFDLAKFRNMGASEEEIQQMQALLSEQDKLTKAKEREKTVAEGIKRAEEQRLGILKSLRDEADRMAMGADEYAIRDLEGADREEALRLQEEMRRMQEDEEHFRRGREMEREVERPDEAFQRRLNEIEQRAFAGDISGETRLRQLEQLNKDFSTEGPTRFAGAMERDSKAAYSATLAAQSGRDDPSKKVAEHTKQSADRLKELIGFTRDLVEIQREAQAVEIPAA